MKMSGWEDFMIDDANQRVRNFLVLFVAMLYLWRDRCKLRLVGTTFRPVIWQDIDLHLARYRNGIIDWMAFDTLFFVLFCNLCCFARAPLH
jgi:hypothetical protein